MTERDTVTRYVDTLISRAANRDDLPVTLLYRDPMPEVELEGESESLTAPYAEVEKKLRAMCAENLSEAGVGKFVFETDDGTFVFDLTFRQAAEHAWCEVMVAPQV